MNHIGFDLIASLMVANDGWGQLALLGWVFPLMLFGVCFQVANQSNNTFSTLGTCLIGAVFIGGWGHDCGGRSIRQCLGIPAGHNDSPVLGRPGGSGCR